MPLICWDCQLKMSLPLSPRVLLLSVLVVLLCMYLHDSQAFRMRFRGRRILRSVRRVIPIRTTRFRARLRHALSRIRLGGGRLRRFRLPRLRISRRRSVIINGVPPAHNPAPSIEPIPVLECENVITRQMWNATILPPSSALTLPLKPIVLYKGWQTCNTHASCIVQARAAYTAAFSYNFMIGGDGKVYEGRGWNNQSDHHIMPSNKATQYGILLVRPDCPSHDATVWDTLEELIGCGIDLGKLATDWNSETDMIFSRLECN